MLHMHFFLAAGGADAPSWDCTYEDDDNAEGYSAGYGFGGCYPSSKGCANDYYNPPAPNTKCFAQAALSNAFRVRNAVRQANNETVKVLRCKY